MDKRLFNSECNTLTEKDSYKAVYPARTAEIKHRLRNRNKRLELIHSAVNFINRAFQLCAVCVRELAPNRKTYSRLVDKHLNFAVCRSKIDHSKQRVSLLHILKYGIEDSFRHCDFQIRKCLLRIVGASRTDHLIVEFLFNTCKLPYTSCRKNSPVVSLLLGKCACLCKYSTLDIFRKISHSRCKSLIVSRLHSFVEIFRKLLSFLIDDIK